MTKYKPTWLGFEKMLIPIPDPIGLLLAVFLVGFGVALVVMGMKIMLSAVQVWR